MEPFFIILFIVFVIVVLIFGWLWSAKRRKELSAWAYANGLSFDSSKDRHFDDRFREFTCLRQGHSRYAYNVMQGTIADLPIIAFDYHYATGSGKNRSDHYISAVITQSPIPLKHLFIRREHIFDKVTEFFGLDDIDFESAEFSRKFFVKAKDKRWAYDVIHQRMMEYLLEGPKLNIQFDHERIIVWNGRRFKPDEFETGTTHIKKVVELLPEYLVKQQTQMEQA